MSDAAVRLGVFGKIPARGDFLDQGLPKSFTDPWHAWLVHGLGQARRELGPRFEEAYLAAPVWRFLLPAGVADDAAWAGLFLPSVDAVGRQFPLTLAWPLPDRSLASAALAEPALFERLEALGRAALAERLDLGSWLSEVAALELPILLPPPPLPDGTTRLDGEPPVQMGLLAAALARLAQPPCCIFQSAGSPHVPPGLRLGPGLPEAAAFTSLIAGDVRATATVEAAA